MNQEELLRIVSANRLKFSTFSLFRSKTSAAFQISTAIQSCLACECDLDLVLLTEDLWDMA